MKDKPLIHAYIDASNKIMNNLSLCYLKTKQYELCVHFSQQVLMNDPTNEKSLFRKAVALDRLGKYEEASAVINDMSRIYREKKFEISQNIFDEMKNIR